jgi:hypothetical protein
LFAKYAPSIEVAHLESWQQLRKNSTSIVTTHPYVRDDEVAIKPAIYPFLVYRFVFRGVGSVRASICCKPFGYMTCFRKCRVGGGRGFKVREDRPSRFSIESGI